MKRLQFSLVFILILMLTACGQATPSATQTSLPSPSAGAENVADKTMTLSFAFGERKGTYTGETAGGLPNGNGVFTSKNEKDVDWTYEGGWENGHFSGMGRTIWSDGYIREGTYKNDRLNGEGRTYEGTRLVYEGSYAADEYDGEGTIYNMRGDIIFKGTFENGFLIETAAERKARLDPFKKQCVSIPYKNFIDNSEQLAGAKVKMTGTVLEVYKEDEGDEEYYEVWISYNNVEANVAGVDYFLSKGEKKLQEGAKVIVWGTFEQLDTYTQNGQEYTEPYFEAWSVEAAPAATPAKTPVKTPVKTPAKTPVKTSAPSQSLVNSWICEQGDYVAVYTFEASGAYTGFFYDSMGDASESGRYTVSGSTIYFDANEGYSYDLSYRFSGSKLILTYPDGMSSAFVVYEP